MMRGLCLRVFGLGVVIAQLVLLAGCGGAAAPTTITPTVAIILNSAPSTVAVGQTIQFGATVSNTSNTAVSWSVNGVAGGNSTVGTISASGLYTAPATVPTPATVTVTVTSQADTTKSDSQTITITIALSLNVTTGNIQVTGTQQFTATILGTSNTAVTWSVNGVVGGNSTVGTISNTGLYTAPAYPPSPNTVTITATSVAYSNISSSAKITLVPPPINVSVTPTALTVPVNTSVQFNATVTTASGVPISTGVTWSVVSPGSLGNAFQGTITQGGLYTAPANVPPDGNAMVPVIVQSVEDPTKSATAIVTIATQPSVLTIFSTSLPNGIVGTAYSTSVVTSGGAQPYTFSITAGSLPAGLNLNPSSGLISGTPTLPGTSNFTVKVTDSTSPTHETATQALSITIVPTLSITTAVLPNGSVSNPFTATLAATGGVTPYLWSVGGSLPAGLSLNSSTGVISGTPTTAGSSTFTISVTDSGSPQQSASRQYTITVYTGLTILTTSLPSGLVGVAYSATVQVAGGTPSYTWSISAGALPAWATLNAATGAITGTPTGPGTSTFTVQVTDQSSPVQTKTQALSITIYTVLSFPAVSLPNGVVGVAYSSTLNASGGTAPYAWSITTGSLPAGLTLNASTGAISGTPTTSGLASFTVKVTDASVPAQAQTQSLSINVVVGVGITISSLPGGVVGTAYSATLTAGGGTTPYTWTISSGALPGWASLNAATGAITGTPNATGMTSFTVKATDSTTPTALTATQPLSITVTNPLAISTTSLPNGVVGNAYSTTLAATGGTTPYTWSITSGALPSCLSLASSTGVISGTPVSGCAGNASFTVKVVDTSNPQQNATQALSINIIAGLGVTSTSLPSGTMGVAYSATLTAAGGTTPYTWSITSGALPGWASLNSATGAITGTPNATGTTSFTVKVTDSTSPTALTATQPLSITINPASSVTVTITSPTPPVSLGVNGAVVITASVSGTSNTALTWAVNGVTNGNTSVGTITGGTATTVTYTAPNAVPGTNPVTITATSQANSSAVGTLMITITSGGVNATPVTVTGGAATSGINFTVTTLTPTLSVAQIGTCSGPPSSYGTCYYGVAPINVSEASGPTFTMLLAGNDLTTGGSSPSVNPNLTVKVTTVTNDVTVTNLTALPDQNGLNLLIFSVQVSSSAAQGARTIQVKDSSTGEKQVFLGGLIIGP